MICFYYYIYGSYSSVFSLELFQILLVYNTSTIGKGRDNLNSKVLGLFYILALIFLVCLAGYAANNADNKSNNTTTPVLKEVPSSSSSQQQYKYINPNHILWMTMKGGKRICTKVLFHENALDKISMIANLVNSGKGQRNSTEEEIGAVNSRIRPIGVAIKQKDENMIYIWPCYKTTVFKDSSGETTGYKAVPHTDRFILETTQGGKSKYYTIYSKDVPKYLREGWKTDMPVVRDAQVTPERSKIGDTVTIAGDGCTEQEVNIYIANNHKEEYHVAKLSPLLGEWKWQTTVKSTFKTLDGKDIELKNGNYHFNIKIGSSQYGIGSIDASKKN